MPNGSSVHVVNSLTFVPRDEELKLFDNLTIKFGLGSFSLALPIKLTSIESEEGLFAAFIVNATVSAFLNALCQLFI